MESIKRVRDATENLMFRKISQNRRNPLLTFGNVQAKEHLALLAKLPAADTPAIGILDPTSPDYGKFIFLVDYSTIDGDDVIL